MKIVSVVGTRPNFVKLALIYKSLSGYCEHIIVHTGQHYDFEMSDVFFKELHVPKPDINLGIGSGAPGGQTGEMIKRLDIEFSRAQGITRRKGATLKPDLVLVYGDTNSTFAGAFAASSSGIPIAHIEAGLRSFDRRMLEERNRILTDHVSDVLFAPTYTAVNNLKNENVIGKIINSGDVSVEVVNNAWTFSKRSSILKKLDLTPKSFILFTMHRAQSTDSEANLRTIVKTFQQLGNGKTERLNDKKILDGPYSRNRLHYHEKRSLNSKEMRVVFPIHPRTKKMLKLYGLYEDLVDCRNVTTTKPIGYIDFIRLVKESYKVVTDSGGVQKEAFLLSVPCITIRRSTEWVETVTSGWNVLTDFNRDEILRNIVDWYPDLPRGKTRIPEKKWRSIFGSGNTSEIIRKHIISMYGS